MVNPLIAIEKTLEKAMYFKNSQRNRFYSFEGVQLIPNNPNKYIQVTNVTGGIHLEDWTVKVMSMCGDELGDITDSFLVEPIPVNSDDGSPQFIWSLKNIPLDFGTRLIYLMITQAVGDTFYSQPFKITSEGSEKTCQIDYKYNRTDEIQSIGVTAWFDEPDLLQELESYYEISTKSWVTASLEEGEIEYWRTEKMPKSGLVQLKRILGLPYVYINSVRASLKETPEIPRKVSQENWGYMPFTLNFHPDDVYIQPDEDTGDFLNDDFLEDDFLIYNTPTP